MWIETAHDAIIVDCGLLFSDLDHFGVEFVIPDFTPIVERREKVRGIFLTHGHEDHVGALAFLLRAGIHAPLFASPFTALLLRERLTEAGMFDRVEIRILKALTPGAGLPVSPQVRLGELAITPVSVNHSIIDSLALLIDTPAGRIVHTGDFKIDPTPFYGTELDSTVFKAAGDRGVALLLSDSTNVERHDHSMSEKVIYQRFEQLFTETRGLTLVSMFASNVARMGQVIELADRLGKRVAISGRTMDQNSRLGAELGYLRQAPNVLIGLNQVHEFPRDKVIILSTGSQAERGSALVRISRGEHPQIKLEAGDLVLMSSKFIPGNEKSIGRMINDLFKQGAEVLYESIHEIHVSGHATRPELKKMIEWTRPRFFVPIHGEYRHLVHHSTLARETGIADDRVCLAVNGDVLLLDKNGIHVEQHIEENRVLVEGREGGDISRLVLKDRRQLGETGVVFSLIVRNSETGRIIAGPDIIARGLTHEAREEWLIEEARTLVRKTVTDFARGGGNVSPEGYDLQEAIRVHLRRFFKDNVGIKPVVLPIILDL